jgi:hypothetical protein
MVYTLLSEFIDPKMQISTPFRASLGTLPIVVYAILERTAVYQVIGEDKRRVARHDLIFVEERRIRKRPGDQLALLLKEARDRGRNNRLVSEYLKP